MKKIFTLLATVMCCAAGYTQVVPQSEFARKIYLQATEQKAANAKKTRNVVFALANQVSETRNASNGMMTRDSMVSTNSNCTDFFVFNYRYDFVAGKYYLSETVSYENPDSSKSILNFKNYDTSTNVESFSKLKLFYDPNGKEDSSYLYEGVSNNTFVLSQRSVSTKSSGNSLPDTSYTLSYDANLNTTPMTSQKRTFAAGQESTLISYNYNSTTSTWTPVSHMSFVYAGAQTSKTLKFWNSATSTWYNFEKYTTLLDLGVGKPDYLAIKKWNANTSAWDIRDSTKYNYYAHDDSIVVYTLAAPNSYLITSKFSKSYDADNNMIYNDEQKLFNGSLYLKSKTESTYQVCKATSIIDITKQHFALQLAPNPSHGSYTTISTGFASGFECAVYNSTGQLVFSKNSTKDMLQLQTNLQPGVYMVQCRSNATKQIAVGKWIIE